MSIPMKRFGAAASALLLAGTLAACGGDSTVDSDDDTQTNVPSVSSSASSSASPSSSDAPTSAAPDTGYGSGDSPRDGEVNEVEEPGGEVAPRTDEDDAFLSQIKDNGIDVEDSAIQDQVIAAAREQCLANEEGRDGFAVPMIAGQLEVQELTDVSAEDAQRIITEAAENHYCG
ncbi:MULTISPECIES: DUF732 domain-containing protein [unclassified Corynebacterium]|uniref:DUF732 domain-containing protein n=1 Tax=unclassified Corynebacterium TaxID=2624378 RepID=UPI0026528F25|nr:DUF732 domain-containing protein [Corynebacterium sp.]MDN6324155.1 DUF732 domain-containing protein [Corynebacterium sp.]MDN6387166.1 DUF732 domain-containing protein [Corynebacterium sp.]